MDNSHPKSVKNNSKLLPAELEHIAGCEECRNLLGESKLENSFSNLLRGIYGNAGTLTWHATEETLEAFVNNTLPSDERKKIALHIEHCPKCKEIVRDFTSMKEEIEEPIITKVSAKGRKAPGRVSSDRHWQGVAARGGAKRRKVPLGQHVSGTASDGFQAQHLHHVVPPNQPVSAATAEIKVLDSPPNKEKEISRRKVLMIGGLAFAGGLFSYLGWYALSERVAFKMVFSGSTTVGEELVPRLVETFCKRDGITQLATDVAYHRNTSGTLTLIRTTFPDNSNNINSDLLGQRVEFKINAQGSLVGLEQLADGQCNVAMSSATLGKMVESAEDHATQRKLHDLEGQVKEILLGYDGIAVICHRDNSVAQLTDEQLKDIFSGKIRDWKDVKGTPDKTIKVYARKDWELDAVPTAINLKNEDIIQGNLAGRYEEVQTSSDMVEKVAGDKDAIGYVSFSFLKDRPQVKAIATGKKGNVALKPTLDNIIERKYWLRRNLLLYLPSSKSANHLEETIVNSMIEFVTHAGQIVVRQIGMIPVSETLPPPPGLPIYKSVYETIAKPIITVHFKSGSAEVEGSELAKFEQTFKDGSTSVVNLGVYGHSDNQGNAIYNLKGLVSATSNCCD